MRKVVWIAGVIGLIVALVGIIGGLSGVATINVVGGPHAPSTFLIAGTMFLAIGIWAGVLDRSGGE